jgi:hypothetical protein
MNSEYRTIGPHHYSRCPACGGAAAFYTPERGALPGGVGGEVTLHRDGAVTLQCGRHGEFEARVETLRDGRLSGD